MAGSDSGMMRAQAIREARAVLKRVVDLATSMGADAEAEEASRASELAVHDPRALPRPAFYIIRGGKRG